MASGRIKGITIEIGGDTTKLNTALKGVDSQLSSTKTALRDVEKLLKLDPGNVELLDQKQRLLNSAIEATKERLETLKGAFSENMDPEEVDALNREIIATEQSLANYESQAAAAGDATQDMAGATQEAADATNDANEGWSVSKDVLAQLAKEGLDKACEAAKELAGYLQDAIGESSAYADDILTLATKYGMSTEQLQEFAYMAELVDVDMDTLTGSMAKLTKNLGEMAKSGEASDEIKRLGVLLYDTNGEFRDADEIFMDVIDKLAKMEPGVERDAIAMELFGKSAQDLNPLIAQGADGIAAFAEEAHEMGAVLDEESLTSLGAMDDGFQRLKQAGTALKNTIGVALAPAITQVSEAVANAAKWFQNLDPEMQHVIITIAGVVAAVVPVIAVITKVIATIKGIATAISGVSAVMNIAAAGPIALIVAGIAAIIAVGVLLYKHWDEIKAWAINLWESVKETFGKIKEGISEAWNNVKEACSETWNKIKDALSETWNNIKDKASETWDNIKSKTSEKLEATKAAVSKIWGAVKENTAQTWANMKANIEENGGGIKGFLTTIGENYKEIWKGIFSTLNDITGGKLEEIFTKIDGILGNIRDAFKDKLNAAKDFVQTAIDKIKGIFDFQWSLPSLKLPHFTISGKFNLNPPSVPSFNVSWYSKAMEEGMILNGATIFGMKGNTLLGGGESGAEAVIGVGSLRSMIQEAVGAGGGVTCNFVINGATDPHAVAQEVSDIITKQVQTRRGAWA